MLWLTRNWPIVIGGFQLCTCLPEMLACLGHAYALSGMKDEAQEIIGELNRLSTRCYVSPANIALIYTGLGERDQAFQWLEKAYEDRSWWLVFLKTDPRFDSIRSDPRLADLLQRVDLTP